MPTAPTVPAGASAPTPVPTSYPRSSRWRDLIAFDSGAVDMPTAGGLPIGPFNLPQLGFACDLWMLVTIASTGNTATVAVGPDKGFAAFSSVSLADMNGANLFGPLTGYQTYLTAKYGGYVWSADPTQDPSYEALSVGAGATAGSGVFSLVIPIEDSRRDFFCALPNADASAAYTAQLITAALASIYTTPPNGTVTIRVQGFLRSRTVPPVTDSAGNPLTQLPVGVAGGKASTQYWNRQVFTVGSGQQTIQSKRVGNVIRKLIFILRQTVTGARDSADWFTLARWLINNTPERVMVPAKWLFDMKSDYGYAAAIDTPGGLDTGVFVLEYQDQLGHPDPSELRDYYLPTRSSTLLQIDGVLGSGVSSYNLELLTNDISPTAGAPISTAGA